MARSFNGSSDKLVKGSSLIQNAPVTMACWFNTDNNTNTGIVMAIANSGNNVQRFSIQMRGDLGGDPISMVNTGNTGVQAIATTSSGFTPGQWHHACGVIDNAADHKIYIDGGSVGTSTTNIGLVTMDRMSIGALERLTPAAFFPGDIMECGWWDVALSVEEIVSLARGFSPSLVRTHHLIMYLPLIGPDYDSGGSPAERSIVKAGDMFLITGAVKAPHGRIFHAH